MTTMLRDTIIYKTLSIYDELNSAKEDDARMDVKSEILKRKLVVICRGVYGDDLLNMAKAIYDGGLRCIEVTFDQSDAQGVEKASKAVEQLNGVCGGELLVGAGTVLDAEQVVAAMNAGATYIISPNVDDDVIRLTKELKLVSIPGAMTPSEVAHAYKVGADIVKLFPAGHLGTKYIKELRAPLSHIPLLATGGVNEETLCGFLDAGCAGAGVGGRLADKKLLAEKNYGEIRKRAEAFVSLLQGRA